MVPTENQFKKDILTILNETKGSGEYVSAFTKDFVFPNIEVSPAGEVCFPVNEAQAKLLINAAHKAPFGMGHETLIDNKVRSAWEINSDQINFNNGQWQLFLNKAIEKVKVDLGLEHYTVSASLYKMLVYEKGDFFLSHRDTEKEKGMFGSMVIVLPSKYTGGELTVSFENTQKKIDFSNDSAKNKICIAAFYADCEHEISPLLSGYRVCLVYNLIQEKSGNKIQAPSVQTCVDKLTTVFKTQFQSDHEKPIIVLLGHQYTPENFAKEALKLNDRYKAEALLLAAQKTDCYAKMCLVTSFRTGTPEYSGDYDDEIDEYTEIDEIIDESLYIEDWIENEIPTFSNVTFEANDLIASFALDEDEPLIKESTGYMGNYGPDIEHWYHYGAVMIWSHEINAQLILQQNDKSKLEWINYCAKNINAVSAAEVAAIKQIVLLGFNQKEFGEQLNYDAIAEWIMVTKDQQFFSKIEIEIVREYFAGITPEYWLKLTSFFSEKNVDRIFAQVMQAPSTSELEHLLSILHSMLLDGRFTTLAIDHINKIPSYLDVSVKTITKNTRHLSKEALQNLLSIYGLKPQNEDWVSAVTALFFKHGSRNFINNILTPKILEETNQTQLTQSILFGCKKYYQKKMDNKPEPPKDWTRAMPQTTYYTDQWKTLQQFIESPSEHVFEYRKSQRDRSEMESAIKNVVIDLKTETVKKGSPHTLVITKTQAEYNKALNAWKVDVEYLNKVTKKLEFR